MVEKAHVDKVVSLAQKAPYPSGHLSTEFMTILNRYEDINDQIELSRAFNDSWHAAHNESY
jgi:hypothetical protein